MNVDQVVKRNGTVVSFDRVRIESSIYAAARAAGNGESRQWAEAISWAVVGILEQRFGQNGHRPHVKEIQDVVEEVLVKSGSPQVAKAYILYRPEQAEARSTRQMLLNVEKLVDDYLQRADWRVNENSNMNYSLQGLNFYVASSIAARYWLHKIYPPEAQRAHVEGDLHLHDLGMLSTYTYFGKEVVIAKSERGIELISFAKLYELCEQSQVTLNAEEEVYAKFPSGLQVLDKDGWTGVSRLVRKKRHRPMRFVKNRGGRSVIVTDNHPMLTRGGEKEAGKVEENSDYLMTVDLRRLLKDEGLFSRQYVDLAHELSKRELPSTQGRGQLRLNSLVIDSVAPEIKSDNGDMVSIGSHAMPRYVGLTEELGKCVGWILADGFVSQDVKTHSSIMVVQKDVTHLVKIADILRGIGVPSCIDRRDDRYELFIPNRVFRLLLTEVFQIGYGARNKILPVQILQFNKQFVKGLLAGLIDGDGNAHETQIQLRLTSRTMLEQCATVLYLLGVWPRDRAIDGLGTERIGPKGQVIRQRYPIYGIAFRKTGALELDSFKYKEARASNRKWMDETDDEWHKVLNNKPTDIPDEFIYDITTDTHTLVVNGMWNHNCCGWDLQDLLIQGFGGVSAKIESKPPKHLRTALGQLVNFFYTLQGESAGAVAVSNFDTLLAPFVRYDGLDFAQTKQAIQEYVFNINVPTRVGFQCVSEDTEILAQDGWKRYDQVQPNDIIATFNIEEGVIEYLPVQRVFAQPYEGKMYRLQNRISDQLVSPGHRVIRKKFNSDEYVLEPIEEVVTLKSPFIVPVGSEGRVRVHDETSLDEDVIRLLAWIIADGTADKSGRGSGRISIYQSKARNPQRYAEIVELCRRLELDYTERTQEGLGEPCNVIRFNAETTRRILGYFNSDKERGIKFIPPVILSLDAAASRVFLETYIEADGHDGCKITTTSEEIRDQLLQVIVHAGYGATVHVRKPDNPLSVKDRYIIRVIRHRDTYINTVEKVEYEGVIWCPNTANETVVARRNGKVFITGNTPFTNQTMDLTPPSTLRDQPVIIGGEPRSETYGEFQHEMDVLNRAFAEVMLEGDAKGRVFTFPIPTYNVTRDFDWDNPELEPVWAMTARYGIPYWANFVNSDMDPEDARSMCPIAAEEKVLIRSTRGRGLEYVEIKNVFESSSPKKEYEVYSDGKFVKGRFNKFKDQEMIKVVLVNGHELRMSKEHLNYAMLGVDGQIEEVKGKDLRAGMYLPYSLNVYSGEGGNRELGYFVGAYAGDGSLDGETSVVFSLNEGNDEVVENLQNIAREYFGARCTIKTYKDTKLLTLKVHSRAAVGLCKDFVAEKQRDKHYRARLFGASTEFRNGALEGHYATDGGNRHRIYTSSKKMVETLNMLAATLGTTTSIYKDGREGRLSDQPNYAVLVYQLNRKNYGDFWFKKEDKLWVKIESIEKIPNTVAYCFEVEKGEPVFTVGTTGILTHNCRLRLDNRELRKRIGGLFAAAPLTGSVGVVTVNMSRLGYLARDEATFLERLERLMEIARTSLEIKREVLERLTAQGLYPYSHHYLQGIKKRFGNYWSNHFSTIGLIGMNEACLNLLGVGIAPPEGKAFAVRTLKFMREVLARFQAETDQLYNLEATPAEGASFRLARADRERFPDIITAGAGEAPYYTNSSHLPVNYSDDLFAVLEHQDELQALYTGGTVQHVFLGEQLDDWRQARRLVRTIAENFHLPYYTLTPTFSICPVHGYIPGEHQYCPYEHTEEELRRFGRLVKG